MEEEIIAESYDEPSKVKKQPDFANKKSNCNNLHFNNNLSIYLKIILIIRSQSIESISWMHKILFWKVRREEIPTEFDNGEETYSNAKDLPASTKLDRSTRYKHVKSHLKYTNNRTSQLIIFICQKSVLLLEYTHKRRLLDVTVVSKGQNRTTQEY